MPETQSPTAWRWRYVLPPEKGAWVWWVGPLVAGWAASRAFTLDQVVLAGTAFAAFSMRQPLTLLARIHWRGRNPKDWRPALIWAGVLGGVALAGAAFLLARGHLWLAPMALAALPLFAAAFYLVAAERDRHQPVMDFAAVWLLAMAAPAAYWAGGGAAWVVAGGLWLFSAMQSSGSVLHVLLRLKQRRLDAMPPTAERWRAGLLPLLHHAFNLAVAAWLYLAGYTPLLVAAAFLLVLLEGLAAVAQPPVGKTPKALGMRQLALSSLFFLLLAAAYVVWP